MPIAAIAEIVIGATVAEGVTAGLMIAGGGLSLVGQATGNKDLVKLGAVASLAAGVSGMTNGFTTNPFASTADAESGASTVTPPEGSSFSDSVAEATAQNADLLSPSASPAAPPSAPSFDLGTPGAPPSAPTDPGIVQSAMPVQPGPTSQDPFGAAADTTGGYRSTLPVSDQFVNPDIASPTLGANPEWDKIVQSPASQAAAEDPGTLTNAWNWFKAQDATTKLAVGNFVAKGLGSIGDFVGPKADETKARAGVLNSQNAIYQTQLSNMNKPAVKVTFTPGAK